MVRGTRFGSGRPRYLAVLNQIPGPNNPAHIGVVTKMMIAVRIIRITAVLTPTANASSTEDSKPILIRIIQTMK